MALKTISAAQARNKMSEVLDDAESGQGTMIIRNSRETAAVVPAHLARLLPLISDILRDLGETIEMSHDAALIGSYRRGLVDLARDDIEWYEV